MSLAGRFLIVIFVIITTVSILATIYNGLVREGFLVITEVTTE